MPRASVVSILLVEAGCEHFVNAVLNKDLFLIIGVVLVFATMLIVDVLYRWIDPRIA
ncbi:MAG: hypothetical protein WD114_06905 [Phycisphaerales bacterium]